MTDSVNNDIEIEVTEADSLREIAKNMGLSVGNLRNVDKLKAMIDEANKPVESSKVTKANKLGAEQAKRSVARSRALKLVRIMITPMAPFERQLKGVTIDVGNGLIGNIRRHVPFNTEWHVEEIVFRALKAKKFRMKKESVDPQTKRKVYSNVFAPAYGITVLDNLTAQQLAELKTSQAARQAID